MAKPVSSIAHHQALSRTDAARQRELGEIARKLRNAEIRVQVLRDQLDSRLFYWHEDGVPIAGLARATGVSRETVYKSIDRYRAQLGD